VQSVEEGTEQDIDQRQSTVEHITHIQEHGVLVCRESASTLRYPATSMTISRAQGHISSRGRREPVIAAARQIDGLVADEAVLHEVWICFPPDTA
jgi:hypothetical protein